ncbi:MAG: branched chain amino acid aminotransferase [Candidatus Tectimicrobiota bacterium]|nr:MAG: branched chain amino acid aminotransferase [Candidatus Tectomicrobia bacterium]
MVQATQKIWMDGKFVDWDKAQVHVLSHTLHYGLGVFEGIRCYETVHGPAIFRLPEHLERLFHSAHIAGLKVPFSPEEIRQAIIDTVKINNLRACYIRPLIYLGYGEMGINNSRNPVCVAIAVWPWGAYLGEKALTEGIRVRISSFTRHHVNVMMTKAKIVGNYANSQLAKMEAVASGYDEAIMLDVHGNVAEGTGENIFIVRRGELKTPPLTAILEGITRNSIIDLARHLGYTVHETVFSRDELYIADEAFFTGTAAEVTPIREVDNRTIGSGRPGPVTHRLQQAFFRIVQGKDDTFKAWLTYI